MHGFIPAPQGGGNGSADGLTARRDQQAMSPTPDVLRVEREFLRSPVLGAYMTRWSCSGDNSDRRRVKPALIKHSRHATNSVRAPQLLLAMRTPDGSGSSSWPSCSPTTRLSKQSASASRPAFPGRLRRATHPGPRRHGVGGQTDLVPPGMVRQAHPQPTSKGSGSNNSSPTKNSPL